MPIKLAVPKVDPVTGIVCDHVMVRHKSGGQSKVLFKTYEQGWRAWQSGARSCKQR